MPLLQTSTKLSLDHAKAFSNWAKDGTSPEGVSIATIVPDAFRSDPASSSSAWHNVEESEILPAKKTKHNKIAPLQPQEEDDPPRTRGPMLLEPAQFVPDGSKRI